MSKYKYGRHANNVSPGVKRSIQLISDWQNVARVLVGHTRAGRCKQHEDGFVRVQRVDEHAIQAVAYGDRRLFELTIIPENDNYLIDISGLIAVKWVCKNGCPK